LETEKSQDELVVKSLRVLGTTLVSEWETLAFVNRHAASLGTAAQIAQFIGYDKAEIAAALRKLEALGLILRSRVSQGIRFYQLSEPLEPSRQSCLLELVNLAQSRAGRLLVIKHLKGPIQE
jgi:DNA-binding MarR family transcriptional regulator